MRRAIIVCARAIVASVCYRTTPHQWSRHDRRWFADHLCAVCDQPRGEAHDVGCPVAAAEEILSDGGAS